MSWRPPEPRQPEGPQPRPDAAAAGNALVWFFGCIAVFGGFLVVVPGSQAQGRGSLWLGVVLLVLGGAGLVWAVRARIRYRRSHPGS